MEKLSYKALLLRKATNCWEKYGKYAKWSLSGLAALYALKVFVRESRYGTNNNSLLTGTSEVNPLACDSPKIKGSTADLPDVNLLVAHQPCVNPAASEPPDTNPIISGPLNHVTIFRGLYEDDVELPDLEDPVSIDAYTRRHQNLSDKYYSEGNRQRWIYHCALGLFRNRDPLASLKTNAKAIGMDRPVYFAIKGQLILLMTMMKDQLKEEEIRKYRLITKR